MGNCGASIAGEVVVVKGQGVIGGWEAGEIEPAPGLRVDWLPDCAQHTQRGPVVRGDVLLPEAHEAADQGGRCVELLHLRRVHRPRRLSVPMKLMAVVRVRFWLSPGKRMFQATRQDVLRQTLRGKT